MNHSEPDWHSVVNQISPSLYRYFAGSFPAPLAADLVQETLIRLVQKSRNGEFSPARGDLKGYAFGIARYVRLETLKDKSALGITDERLLAEQPAAENNGLDQVVHLRWAISRLKPVEQEIILLLIDSELQLEQIAETLGLPLGTIKSHVHRAKEKLRQIMEVVK